MSKTSSSQGSDDLYLRRNRPVHTYLITDWTIFNCLRKLLFKL